MKLKIYKDKTKELKFHKDMTYSMPLKAYLSCRSLHLSSERLLLSFIMAFLHWTARAL